MGGYIQGISSRAWSLYLVEPAFSLSKASKQRLADRLYRCHREPQKRPPACGDLSRCQAERPLPCIPGTRVKIKEQIPEYSCRYSRYGFRLLSLPEAAELPLHL